MKVPTLILLLTTVFGCASYEPLTPEELEYNRNADVENWQLCMQILERQQHVRTYHDNHEHKIPWRVKHWMLESDLRDNHCRILLGDYWAHGVKRTKIDKKNKKLPPR